MLFAELACWCAYKGVSVYSMLTGIYDRLGYVYDNTLNIKYSGLSAMDDMNAVVQKIRALKPASINNFNVVAIRDYLTGERFLGESVEKLEYSGINCIYYELENGSFVCLRPSGTEPKLKIYYSISAKNKETAIKNYQEIASSF